MSGRRAFVWSVVLVLITGCDLSSGGSRAECSAVCDNLEDQCGEGSVVDDCIGECKTESSKDERHHDVQVGNCLNCCAEVELSVDFCTAHAGTLSYEVCSGIEECDEACEPAD